MPGAEILGALRALDALLTGDVVESGTEEWDVARRAWNLAVDQQPVAVVFPASAGDVATTVAFAAEHGLKVACQGGGHNAGPISWEDATLLVKTERLRGITIDAPARRARVEAGVLADELAVAAGEHGLAYLAGTSPDVGVVGYAVGGGISWLVRRHGLACNSIVAVELVTADGRLVRADRDTEPDLLLGGARRWRQLRRDHRARARAVSDRAHLRRRPLLADRACRRDPLRLARAGSRPSPRSAPRSAGC